MKVSSPRCGRRRARPNCASFDARVVRRHALLKVEVAGICGTDVKMYKAPPFDSPVIMGHENVGTIAVAGEKFKRLHGVVEGDRVFVEHYVGCYNCEWCRIGEYRHCEATDWHTNPNARRYGYTSSTITAPCGVASRSTCTCPGMPCCTRCRRCHRRTRRAGHATVQRHRVGVARRRVGYSDTVLIQGPGSRASHRWWPASRRVHRRS